MRCEHSMIMDRKLDRAHLLEFLRRRIEAIIIGEEVSIRDKDGDWKVDMRLSDKGQTLSVSTAAYVFPHPHAVETLFLDSYFLSAMHAYEVDRVMVEGLLQGAVMSLIVAGVIK